MKKENTISRINAGRIRRLNNAGLRTGPVIYWMSRDQRIHDNWALLYAQERAIALQQPLIVIFCLVPGFQGAVMRQYRFMLESLKQVAAGLKELHIPFFMFYGFPKDHIPNLVKDTGAGLIVADFDPLRIKRQWKTDVIERIAAPVHEVDAHNIVPCWMASPKQEYAAYTFRPKIQRMLDEFMDPFVEVKPHPFHGSMSHFPEFLPIDAGSVQNVNDTGPHATDYASGEAEAKRVLERFIREKLPYYAAWRNDPNRDCISGLSPYLHFGQISAQAVALAVSRAETDPSAKEAFLEELIVRRELSDNFCLNNPDYDNWNGFPEWGKKTLNEHRPDPREVVTPGQFENAETHDALWNACQQDLVQDGKLHGYLRMYWAKKILEWSPSPEAAIETAIMLNDRYSLDGRDPNGYTGIAWSIGGVHDRAWFSRPVFGKIRYMSERGARSKFDVDQYIRSVTGNRQGTTANRRPEKA
ncbi:deoxyribodipyrimidine photo-lyase [bacterium]|nr:deoxyribodipyrimidine photo-lyase [bacterium]